MALQSQQFMTDLKVNMTPDTVQIRTASTVNSYGERTFTGGATTYDAYIIRVEEARRTVEDNLVDVASSSIGVLFSKSSKLIL